MGHRLSKLNWSSSSNNRTSQNSKTNTTESSVQRTNLVTLPTTSSSSSSSSTIDVIATTTSDQNHLLIESATLTVPGEVVPRRFIIKIQLTKMELPNGQTSSSVDATVSTSVVAIDDDDDIGGDIDIIQQQTNDNLDNNLNNNKQILNLTFTKNILCDHHPLTITTNNNNEQNIQIDEIKLNNLNSISNFKTTTSTNSLSVNTNFVNNFPPHESSSPTASSTTINIKGNNDENNCINNCERLNNFNLATNNNINNNNLNHTNSTICNISTIPNNNNLKEMNLNKTSTNCINNNNSNNNNNSSNCKKSSENHEELTEDCNSGFSTLCAEDGKNHCCRRKKSTSYPSKWRCCKCACRDNGKSSNNNNNNNNPTTSESIPEQTAAVLKATNKRNWATKFNCAKRNNSNNNNNNNNNNNINSTQDENVNLWSISTESGGGVSSSQSSTITTPSSKLVGQTTATHTIPCVQQHLIQTLARCGGGGSSNVFVFSVNHPQPSQFVVGPLEDCDERARRLRALEIENGVEPPPGFISQQQQQQPVLSQIQSTTLPFSQVSGLGPEIVGSALANAITSSQNAWHMLCNPSVGTFGGGTVVHSQVDYIHCLVPDLEKITSSSFYWGKMDRYEAERLLEGKPEGTFLLRDSAQEEYLFSVTFRKYGRSLHARIEQFNHKFSFDCHDPGVFTASTVTGLLEHYKDPSCVMFFEPMLTIPLNRNFTFSLQQLCRATIVSNAKYDSINELQLPNSLKSYLKEYHYKLRVRVKPFDEPFYTCS